MKLHPLVILFVLTSCGGTLTDQQRKKVKEEMDNSVIRKVSEAQIAEEAFAMGRSFASLLEKEDTRKYRADSLRGNFGILVGRLVPSDTSLHSIEGRILEAYVASAATIDNAADNVQRLSADTLLFTKAYFQTDISGVRRLDYALSIKLPKRTIVLSIGD